MRNDYEYDKRWSFCNLWLARDGILGLWDGMGSKRLDIGIHLQMPPDWSDQQCAGHAAAAAEH